MPIPKEVFEKIVFYRREVERIWNEYLGPGHAQHADAVPVAVDIYETDDRTIIDIEVPGVDPDGLEVKISTQVLVVEGERKKPETGLSVGARYQQAERIYGRFQRILEIPTAGDMTRIEARLEAGVLRIVILKVLDRRGQWRRVAVTRVANPEEVAHGG